jgi:hypothetical protein
MKELQAPMAPGLFVRLLFYLLLHFFGIVLSIACRVFPSAPFLVCQIWIPLSRLHENEFANCHQGLSPGQKIENQTGIGSAVESSSAGSHYILQIAGQITRSVKCRHASVWRELVAFRAGEMQPGAGDTSSRQTEADATAFLQCRSGRAGGK